MNFSGVAGNDVEEDSNRQAPQTIASGDSAQPIDVYDKDGNKLDMTLYRQVPPNPSGHSYGGRGTYRGRGASTYAPRPRSHFFQNYRPPSGSHVPRPRHPGHVPRPQHFSHDHTIYPPTSVKSRETFVIRPGYSQSPYAHQTSSSNHPEQALQLSKDQTSNDQPQSDNNDELTSHQVSPNADLSIYRSRPPRFPGGYKTGFYGGYNPRIHGAYNPRLARGSSYRGFSENSLFFPRGGRRGGSGVYPRMPGHHANYPSDFENLEYSLSDLRIVPEPHSTGPTRKVETLDDIHFEEDVERMSKENLLNLLTLYEIPHEAIEHSKAKLVERVITLWQLVSTNIEVQPIEQEDIAERTTCCICFEGSKEMITLPCRHLATCSMCCSKCDNCPICREPIQQRLKIFVS